MTDQSHPKTIEVDSKGEPITSGIPVYNNADYAAKYAGVGLLTWFIFGPVILCLLFFAANFVMLCMFPGLILLEHYPHADGGLFAVIGILLMIIGFGWSSKRAWRFSKRLVGGFCKHTKLRYVGPYEGPAPWLRDDLRQFGANVERHAERRKNERKSQRY